ncbi:hypothetical protein [Pseudomonas arsenicoxydans]|uniref:hypothetical protein n=1 Tax=Pseudomonas arsenicoxydans TaxID=702115 RepID=UPI0011268538|nr:hypothetical protein [Pseudomonas arsenicoxydans]
MRRKTRASRLAITHQTTQKNTGWYQIWYQPCPAIRRSAAQNILLRIHLHHNQARQGLDLCTELNLSIERGSMSLELNTRPKNKKVLSRKMKSLAIRLKNFTAPTIILGSPVLGLFISLLLLTESRFFDAYIIFIAAASFSTVAFALWAILNGK